MRELLSTPEDRMEGVCGCLTAEMPTAAWAWVGALVTCVCTCHPPLFFSVLSSSRPPSSPLFLSLICTLTSLLSMHSLLSLFSTISRPGCFFKGGPLAISPAPAHILPTQEERAFPMSRVHLWISRSGQRLVLWGL